jgi:hypothetical protein
VYLWPRLGPAAQTELLRRLRRLTPQELRAVASPYPAEDTTWYPTGTRVPPQVVSAVVDAIRAVAEDAGWPDLEVGDRQRRTFDQQLSGRLHELMSIVPSDAAHPGVWAHLALVSAPEVARWRYPANQDERYVSTHRNVFGRLWWRAHRLGAEDDSPSSRLGEDQAVAILERPSLASRSRLSTVFAAAVVAHPDSSQNLMREAAIWLRRQLAVVEVGVLDESALSALVDEALKYAGAVLQSARSD